jgi:hypothetical protein
MSYKPGDYLVICDQCGFERYASECRMTWDNLFVCADTCWEPKHPHFTPPKPLGEAQSVPIHRKESSYPFVSSVDEETLEPTTTSASPNDGYFIETPITGDDL